MKKVAINGFGRIGRLVFRIMEDDPELKKTENSVLKNMVDKKFSKRIEI